MAKCCIHIVYEHEPANVQPSTEKRAERMKNYCYLLFWGKRLLIDKLN